MPCWYNQDGHGANTILRACCSVPERVFNGARVAGRGPTAIPSRRPVLAQHRLQPGGRVRVPVRAAVAPAPEPPARRRSAAVRLATAAATAATAAATSAIAVATATGATAVVVVPVVRHPQGPFRADVGRQSVADRRGRRRSCRGRHRHR